MRQLLLSREFSVRPRRSTPCRAVLALACAALVSGAGLAQQGQSPQLIGYVSTSDADINGATDVMDGRAVLAGSVEVTARDRTAPVTLGRGGTVQVCQTSALHLTESKAAESAPPLLFSLDRGAIEIQMNGTADDAIMTPDLRLTVRSAGPLDLRLRVARNGDTCVENRGAAAPTLAVSDPFGASNYELMAGQHVLFEHGSVHEVVDHESEPCGCPDPRGANMAEALLAPSDANTGAKTSTPPTAHPFPAAISEGLAPTAEATPSAGGVAQQPQVTDALRYSGESPPSGNADNPASGNASSPPSGNGNNPASGSGSAAAGSGDGTQVAAAAPAPKLKRRAAKEAAQSQDAATATGSVSGPASEVRPASPAQQNGGASGAPAQKKSEDESPNRDLVHMIGHFFHVLFGH